ncbi:hypothetical protein FDB23_16470 [Clostridium botulinum]|nr:hypothetical protein [Clostridium botulinum]
MKKNLLFIVIILISIFLIFKVFCYDTDINDNISIMYTDKDYKSTYSIYNTHKKSIKNIFYRKNENYSDFIIDKVTDTFYFSDLVNNKYNIYKMDLSNNNKLVNLLNNEYSGDIFDLNNDKIIFRTFTADNTSYTLGVYNLKENKIKLWDNQDSDSYVYNFYWDKDAHVIYTIERSIKDMESTQDPIHNIFKYDENGKNKELLYSTRKFINNISVNEKKNKIIFDAATIENNNLINKIYLLNLDNNTEQILLESNENFNSVKKPKLSPNGNGFYFLATTSKSKIIEDVEGSVPIMSNAIYYYDFTSNKTSKTFEDSNFIINNFKLN